MNDEQAFTSINITHSTNTFKTMRTSYAIWIRAHSALLVVIFLASLAASELAYYFAKTATDPIALVDSGAISLAAAILYGYGVWPAIVLASIVDGVIQGASPLFIVSSTIGNTLAPFVALFFLRLFKFDRLFFHVRDVLLFVTITFFSSMITPTSLALTTMYSNGMHGTTLPIHWFGWWVSAFLSTFVFSALVIRWMRPISAHTTAEYVERACAYALLFFVSYVSIYVLWTPWQYTFFPLLAAVLFWMAFRMRPRWMTLGLFVMICMSYVALFVRNAQHSLPVPLPESLLYVQIIDLSLSVFFFVLAALEEQRLRAARAYESHAEKLERALHEIRFHDNAKNDFIAQLGHELRNPLASVLSSVELLAIDTLSRDDQKRIISAMERRVKMMSYLLDDMLDIAQITKRKLKLQKTDVVARDAMRSAAESMHDFIGKMHHTLEISLPPETALVHADRVRLEQIMINLLHNAAKYTPRGGTISFSGRVDGNSFVFSVKDTGRGIRPDMKERIFERFVQLNPERSASGLGLGLSLVKNLVQLHRGEINVLSEGEGRGSEFIVRIPIVSEQAASEPARVEAVEHASHHRSVLIVDDNEDAANGLSRLFQLRSHKTFTAFNGKDALELAFKHMPDAIILDIGLPDEDGYSIARKLRGAHVGATLIALSGYGQRDDKDRARAAGFDHHVTKPASFSEIERLVDNAHV